MKKNLLIVILFCFSTCFLNAQVECSTIAQLKEQNNGDVVLFTGDATTTFYDSSNGLLIEDETGAILLSNSKCSAYGDKVFTPNMVISNVKGTFYVSDNTAMVRIKVEDEDLSLIQKKSENVALEYAKPSLDEYISNPSLYEGKAVELEAMVYQKGTKKYLDGSENDLPLTTRGVNIVPAKAVFRGYYGSSYGTWSFMVPSAEYIDAKGFFTVANLKAYVKQETSNEYEIIDPMLVTAVEKRDDMNILFVQQGAESQARGIVVYDKSKTDLAIGDSIKGLKGKFELFVANTDFDKNKGACFVVESGASINILSRNNKISPVVHNIYDLKNYANLYESTFISLPEGKVKVNDGEYVFVNESQYGLDSIRLTSLSNVNLSDFIGKDYAISGVFDVARLGDVPSLVIRGTMDFLASEYAFDDIASLLAFGEPAAEGIKYVLSNPVQVTYKYVHTEYGVGYHSMFVKDNSGALYITLPEKNDFEIGDYVSGIRGTLDLRNGIATPTFVLDSDAKLELVSENNPIEPELVTFSQLLSDKIGYSSKVVLLRNVKHGTIKHSNGGTEKFLYQDSDTIYYNWDMVLYDSMKIVAVVDYRATGEYFSILPLSQEYITEETEEETGFVDNALNVSIYSNQGVLYVESDNLDVVEVYDIVGHKYMGQVSNGLFRCDNLKQGVYLIKVNGELYKTIVK